MGGRRSSHLAVGLALLGGCTSEHVVGENLVGAARARFAVAYVDAQEAREDHIAWRIEAAIGRVINISRTGLDLDLAALTVVEVTDDSPLVDLALTVEGSADYVLPPGHAGGRVVGGDKWIDPLVPEPVFDERGPSLQLRIDYLDRPAPPVDTIVRATFVLALDDHQASWPFELRVRATGPFGARMLSARRVVSAPIDE